MNIRVRVEILMCIYAKQSHDVIYKSIREASICCLYKIVSVKSLIMMSSSSIFFNNEQ